MKTTSGASEDPADKTADDMVADKSHELQNAFGLSAEDADVAANDQLSKRRRKPESNDVDTERAERAQAEARD